MKNKINMKLVFAEIVLIIASVFIFRGLWLLLDLYDFMYERPALWASLIIGIVIAVRALRYIIKSDK